MSGDLDFSEWRTQLLVLLADADSVAGGKHVDLLTIARQHAPSFREGWVRKAAKLFEQNGWADVTWTIGEGADGGIHIELNGRGLEAAETAKRALNLQASTQPQGTAKITQVPNLTSTAPVSIMPNISVTGNNAKIVIAQQYIQFEQSELDYLKKRIDELTDFLRNSNEIPRDFANQTIGELEAGRTIANTPKPDVSLLQRLLLKPLAGIAEQFSKTFAGAAASALIGWLRHKVGI